MSGRKARVPAADVGSLVEKILADKGLDGKIRKYRAWTIWDDVVGPQIARNARPLRIRGDVLEVRVEQAAWMQQLQLMKPKILAELNRHLGENALADIFWKRGKIEPPAETADDTDHRQAASRPLTRKEQEQIDRVTRDVTDPELRNKLNSLFGRAQRQNQSGQES